MLDPVTDVQREPDGIRFVVKSGVMKLQVCSDSIIRVLYTRQPVVSRRTRLCGYQEELARHPVVNAIW